MQYGLWHAIKMRPIFQFQGFSPVAGFSLQSESPAANQSTIQSNLFIQRSTAEYVKYNVK